MSDKINNEIITNIFVLNDKSNPELLSVTEMRPDSTVIKKVQFSEVKLYLFDRTQGFECIPSDDTKNSITLGMSYKHCHLEQFNKLDDYLNFKRQNHLEKLEVEKEKILNNDDLIDSKILTCDLSDEAIIENENRKILEIMSNKKEYESIDIDLPINMEIFCPIMNPFERRQKLIEAGFKESDIDETEANEIKSIKASREICGCKCTQLGLQCGVDELCACFANGIGCQLDKTRYPCDCTVRKCKNPYGLKRFDQKSVVKHYLEVLSDNYKPKLTDEPEQTMISKPAKRKRKRKSGCYAMTNKKRKVMPQISLLDKETPIESHIENSIH